MIALYFGQLDLAKIVMRHTATTNTNKTADPTSRQNNERAANATPQQPMLNLRRVPLAPELVTAPPDDDDDDGSDQASVVDCKLADVWQFGQLAYQFLCCSAEKSSGLLTCSKYSASHESKAALIQHFREAAGNLKWRDGDVFVSAPLRELIVRMVLPAPRHRPNIDQVVEKISAIVEEIEATECF